MLVDFIKSPRISSQSRIHLHAMFNSQRDGLYFKAMKSKITKLMFVLKLNIYKTITLGNLQRESKIKYISSLSFFIKDCSVSPGSEPFNKLTIAVTAQPLVTQVFMVNIEHKHQATSCICHNIHICSRTRTYVRVPLDFTPGQQTILQYNKVVKVTTLVTSDQTAFSVTSFERTVKEALQKREPRASQTIFVKLSNVFSSNYNIYFSIYNVPIQHSSMEGFTQGRDTN